MMTEAEYTRHVYQKSLPSYLPPSLRNWWSLELDKLDFQDEKQISQLGVELEERLRLELCSLPRIGHLRAKALLMHIHTPTLTWTNWMHVLDTIMQDPDTWILHLQAREGTINNTSMIWPERKTAFTKESVMSIRNWAKHWYVPAKRGQDIGLANSLDLTGNFC